MHVAPLLILLLGAAPAAPPFPERPGDARADPLALVASAEAARAPASQLAAFAASGLTSVRARTAWALGRIRDPEAVPILEGLAADPEPQVRCAAAFGLGLAPGGASALRSAWAHETDPTVRPALLEALGHAGDGADLGLLRGALGERDPRSATAAAHALGRLALRGVPGTEVTENVDALLAALLRLDPDLKRAAAFALARGTTRRLPPDRADRLVEAICATADGTARALLVRAAASGLDAPRWERLASLLCVDPDPGVRIALARAVVARGGDPTEATPLLALADDAELGVRVAALEAIDALPHPLADLRFRKLLLDILDREPGLWETSLAVAALLPSPPSGDASVDRTLVDFWIRPDMPEAFRRAALDAVEDPADLEQYALTDPLPAVRTAATEALLARSAPSRATLQALLGSEDPVVAGQAATYLSAHPDPSLWDGLCDLLTRSDAEATPRLPDDLVASALDACGPLARTARAGARTARLAEVAQRAASGRGLRVQRAFREAFPEGVLPRTRPGRLAGLPGSPPPADEARVVTDRGAFVIQLLGEVAPLAVDRFAELAEADVYDGLPFHRVVPDFVVQGGDPRGDGWGGTGRLLPDELSPLPYEAFSVGFASAGPDTADSQWFVTLSPQPHLTGAYTLFGRVVLGQDVLLRLQRQDHVRDVIVVRRDR
ncbi:MAG: peptidylprolyl isomerase [Deltaproteobacteria bacterium]|nr:peptidylprolyl isomerase [Deltaproteobacteria bacterium]